MPLSMVEDAAGSLERVRQRIEDGAGRRLLADEVRMLDLMARGVPQKELGLHGFGGRTRIGGVVCRMYLKLGATNLQEAIQIALRQGYRIGGLMLDPEANDAD